MDPTRDDDPLPPRLRAWQVVAVFGVALVVLLLGPQRGVHGVDGHTFAVWVEEGATAVYSRHIGYLWLCGLVYAGLEPAGATGHDALLVASALGSAGGLALLTLAFARLFPGRIHPVLGALAVVATPSWLYFATIGEIPGVLAAGVGLSWWLFARWLDRPTAIAAAALGVCTALTATLHALGHLLPIALPAVAFVLRRLPERGRVGQAVAMLVAHFGLATLLSVLLARGASGQADDIAFAFEERWATFAPLTTPAVFWREWIVPYLPWSIGAFVALAHPASRKVALAALVAFLLYLPANVVFLGFYELHERGAYFAPVAPLLFIAVAHRTTARRFLVIAAVGLVVTVISVAPGWRNPVPPEFGTGVAELNAERPLALVVANEDELAGARTATRGLVLMDLAAVVSAYEQQPKPKPGFAGWFDLWFGQLRRQGLDVVFSAATGAMLSTTEYPGMAAFWNEHLPQNYALAEVERLGFRGTFVRPK